MTSRAMLDLQMLLIGGQVLPVVVVVVVGVGGGGCNRLSGRALGLLEGPGGGAAGGGRRQRIRVGQASAEASPASGCGRWAPA